MIMNNNYARFWELLGLLNNSQIHEGHDVMTFVDLPLGHCQNCRHPND